MRPLYLLIITGSSFLVGSIFGVSEDTRDSQRHQRAISTTASSAHNYSSVVATSSPFLQVVEGLSSVLRKAQHFIMVNLLAPTPFMQQHPSASAWSGAAASGGGGGAGRSQLETLQRQNRILAVLLGTVGVAGLAIVLTDLLDLANERQRGGTRLYQQAMMARAPPQNYEPQTIHDSSPDDLSTNNPNPHVEVNYVTPPCVVCLTHCRDTVCEPCGHVALDWSCAMRMCDAAAGDDHAENGLAGVGVGGLAMRAAGGTCVKCPICRENVEQFSFVHMA